MVPCLPWYLALKASTAGGSDDPERGGRCERVLAEWPLTGSSLFVSGTWCMRRASVLGAMLQWLGVITDGISKKKITKKKHPRDSKAE